MQSKHGRHGSETRNVFMGREDSGTRSDTIHFFVLASALITSRCWWRSEWLKCDWDECTSSWQPDVVRHDGSNTYRTSSLVKDASLHFLCPLPCMLVTWGVGKWYGKPFLSLSPSPSSCWYYHLYFLWHGSYSCTSFHICPCTEAKR